MSFLLTKVPYLQQPMRYEYRLTPKGLDLYPPIVTLIVYWGDVHLSGKKGGLWCIPTISVACLLGQC